MKKPFTLIIAALLFAMSSFGQSALDNWPEMKAYHTVLSQTFHPAEEGDLKPIRKRSHELLADIKLVNASPLPAEVDNEDMRKLLKKLQKENDKLNAFVVREEQSATVMKQLTIVHDIFHEILGICKKDKTDK